jgi:hypothetical protein
MQEERSDCSISILHCCLVQTPYHASNYAICAALHSSHVYPPGLEQHFRELRVRREPRLSMAFQEAGYGPLIAFSQV